MDFPVPIEFPVPNASFSCLAYQEYLLMPGEVHTEDWVSLVDYVAVTSMVLSSDNVGHQMLDNLCTFPGELDQVSVASEEGKKVPRSLMKALWILEESGVCLDHFGVQHIVVTRSGKAKFRGVNLVRNLEGQQLQNRLQAHYYSVRDIIAWMYPPHARPDDIAHLLSIMPNNFVYEDRKLFRHHAALIQMAKNHTLYKEVYDHILCRLPPQDFHNILLQMRADLSHVVDNWRQEVQTNNLLMQTFNYNLNSYIAIGNTPNQNSYTG